MSVSKAKFAQFFCLNLPVAAVRSSFVVHMRGFIEKAMRAEIVSFVSLETAQCQEE